MAKDFNKGLKNRIRFLQFLFAAAILSLCAKSFDIQIFKAEELARKAETDYSKYLVIKGERGEIFDAGMNKLATSTDAISVTASPALISSSSVYAQRLSGILDLDKKELEEKLSGKRMFAWVKRKITPEQARQVKKLNLKGIYFENDSKRFYPNKTLGAQILGFTGNEDNGLEGIEFKYNSWLEGKQINIRVNRDGNGRILDLDKRKTAELKGSSVVLTIDKKIQFLSEQTLASTVINHQAKSGMALVMKPKTGEILSIAHYPQFNPNNFQNYPYWIFRNRAVTDAFEPGSAMKVFTAAAALQKGFGPKAIFFCENGRYRIGSFNIHDTHEHAWLSINQIIKFSSNIGAAKIVETIGDKALFNYLSDFGFGGRTGVDSPGETSGALAPWQKWSDIDAAAISFGQGIAVSAIQLITGVSAIANEGRLMKPMLVKKIVSNTGEDVKIYHPKTVRQVVKPETARIVKRMMNLAVQEEGTGSKAAMTGYSVCGKTGTAQKASKNRKGYSKGKYMSVFAGFAPEKDPELAILVVVDEPQKNYYGGDVAAPAFKTIMAGAFNYLNIAPEKSAQMVALLTTGDKR